MEWLRQGWTLLYLSIFNVPGACDEQKGLNSQNVQSTSAVGVPIETRHNLCSSLEPPFLRLFRPGLSAFLQSISRPKVYSGYL